jgi:hypothetical protein
MVGPFSWVRFAQVPAIARSGFHRQVIGHPFRDPAAKDEKLLI